MMKTAGAEGYNVPDVVCDIYFAGVRPCLGGLCGRLTRLVRLSPYRRSREWCASWWDDSCLGGLLAVDGRTGRELWRHYSTHEVFAVNCNRDLNADSVHDCIVAGRVGVCIGLYTAILHHQHHHFL